VAAFLFSDGPIANTSSLLSGKISPLLHKPSENMSSSSSAKMPFFLLSLVAIILDQLSKWEILKHFTEGERLNIIPDFFDLTLAYNPGAAFSFLADQGGWQKFFFLGLAVVISLVDRLIHGHVVDFLLFYWQNWFYPAFNIADSFICVGAICLVLDGLLHKKTSSNDTKAV